MSARLIAAWSHVKDSLWALPLAMVALSAVLAVAAVEIRLEDDPTKWWLYGGTSENAAEFLSSLLSSMINMATLAISITMVVLTLAAQQLGPRLIPSFMNDRRTQTALGLFMGTAVYLLLVLRIVQGREPATVPHLAVTIGTALVLACVVALVLFVHHLARSIVADTMIERVGSALDEAIEAFLLPQKKADRLDEAPIAQHSGIPLHAYRGGYIQFINYEKLLTAAAREDAVIELTVRPGHHILQDGLYGWVRLPTRISNAFRSEIENSILIGSQRTVVQDVEYSVRQLVEIALRALSPGVNDPYTALAVIDRLAQALGHVLDRGAPRHIWRDETGEMRILAPVSDFDGILDAAFTQIRQSGEDHPAILIRLAEKIGQLAAQADPRQCASLLDQLELIEAAGQRGIAEKADRAILERRGDLARKACQAGMRGRLEVRSKQAETASYRPKG